MKTHPLIFITGIIAAIAMLGVLAFEVMSVRANPSQIQALASATATTTVTYLYSGAATSTPLVLDTQTDGGFSADSATLMICPTASTTNSGVDIFWEYSQDGITYAQNDLSALGTTTPIVNIGTVQQMRWAPMGSTTIAGLIPGPNTNVACKIVSIPTPSRYVRVYEALSNLSTGLASSTGIWQQWIYKKENR